MDAGTRRRSIESGESSGAIQAAVRTLCAKTGARSRHELITICLDSHPSVPDDKLLRASLDHLRELEAHVAKLEQRISRMEGRQD